MATSGKVKTLYSDKAKTEALFPRTKTSAVSDDGGTGLNTVLDNICNSIDGLNNQINQHSHSGSELYDAVPINKGGTGASNPGQARANLGAAPAGLVNGIYYVSSLADFESRIEEVYNSMENCTERVIQMDLTSGTTEVHSGDWYITIARRNASNGFLRMTKSLDAVVSHQRYRYNGSWGPWTWETPLMKPGVEYRTTERYNGESVYTQVLSCGTLIHGAVVNIPTNCKVLRYAARSNGYVPYPYGDRTNSDFRAVKIEYGKLTMLANTDSNGMEDVFCQIWYIKV